MKGKWVSSIMAGIFIAMGAMVYLSVPNTLIGSMLFATGIFLVLNLHNMLITRVCPLMGIRPQISLDGYRHLLDRERAWHTGRRAYRILYEIRDRHQQFCKNDSGDKTE